MSTNHLKPDYNYTPNNNDRSRDQTYINPKQTNGSITNRTKDGLYNIVEKEYDDRKVFYYVPAAYGNDYDLSQLEEELFPEQQPKQDPPVDVRQQYHQPSDSRGYEYSPTPPRRDMHVSPRRPVVIKRIYFDPTVSPPPPPPSPQKIEYIVRNRAPRKRYVEEIQPIRRTVYVEKLPPIARSPQALSTPRAVKPLRLEEYSSPRRPKLTQQNFRETPIKIISPNRYEQKYISLKEVLAENRARRGSRIPKPRREVDEEQIYDLPTYRRNFVKNDFLVHK